MKQANEAQLEFGLLLRDAGAEAVDGNTPDDWKVLADKAIERLAATGQEFTAENVREIVGDPPNHPNAMGARFLAAARSGTLVKVGYRSPARASSHASVIAVWKGIA